MLSINDLIIPAAVILLVGIGLTVISHQKDTITELEQERATLTAKLTAQAEATARADTEVAQLSQKLQTMRKRATAKEDKVNEEINKESQKDSCLNSRLPQSIIDSLRPTGKN